MDKPTEEQKKELLEWCGFKLRCPPEKDAYSRGIWDYPDGLIGDVELDLNNLFKYAVPKLVKTNTYFMMCYSRPQNEWYVQAGLSSAFNKDPALALFWALWQALKKELKDG